MEKLVPISAHIVESVWHYQDGSVISMFKDGAVPGKDMGICREIFKDAMFLFLTET